MGQTADELKLQEDSPDAVTTSDDPEEIREEIEQTRTEMSGTIDAIQERLSPDAIKEQAKEAVREATIGKAQTMMDNVTDTAQQKGASVWETLRANPVPTAMAALGIGLLVKNRRDASMHYDYDYDRRGTYRSSYTPRYAATGAMTSSGRYASERYPGYQGYAGSEAGGREAESGMGQRVGEMAGTAQEKAGQAVDQVTQKGSQALDSVTSFSEEGFQAARERYDQMIMESPLALGLVAFGVGAAVGLVVPSTQRENELMGETRDQLVDRAEDMAQQTLGKAQEVASQVGSSVQQSMQQSSGS